MALTDAKIRALRPTGKAYKVSDFGGLYINVTAKGARLWRLKYRHNGKEGKLSFGPYPEISLKEPAIYEMLQKQISRKASIPPISNGRSKRKN